MITEDYVSFEVAKLLKEKGFLKGVDLRITQNLSFYDDIGLHYNLNKYYNSLILDKIDFVVAPTIQMTMKWLREVHNVNIDIVSIWNQKRFEYQVFVVTPENAKQCYVDDKLYLGYEEAVEGALKYCLKNLI